VPADSGTAASSAAVQCEVDMSTGAAGGGVPITVANKPGNAILTTSANPAEDGLNVKALNSSLPFAVRGSVYSNSTVNVTSGSLQASNGVYAHSGCSGTIISTPPPNCSVGTVTTPSYSTNAAAVPAYRQVPANVSANCPGGVMTFEPGYYDDAKALSDLMDGNGTCKNSVWWFKPGSYYFDFQNASGALPSMSGTDEWLVKNGQLLAGTPVNAAGTPVAAPVKPISLPGACWNPIKSTAAVGVQFVFGGDSRMQVTGNADGRPYTAMGGALLE
jgi:hypothetical protein